MTRILKSYKRALKGSGKQTEPIYFRVSPEDKKAIVQASKQARRSQGGYLLQLHRIATGEVPIG